MTVEIPVERPRRRWGLWLLGLAFVVVVFTAGRLVYPKFRQQQLIEQLKARGFTFTRRDITGDWRKAWVQYSWLPQSLRTAYNQEIVVSNPPGTCSPENFALLTELISWDEEWFHSPSRSWMSLNLKDVTDQDLIWMQPRVQYLIASGPEVTDDGMAPFRRTPYMATLALDARQIGDRGLAHLAGLKDLVYLQLNGEHITDAGLVHLAGMTQLRRLRLAGTQVTGAGLVHLAGLTSLEHLDLTNSQVTGDGLDQLLKLPLLGTLILNKNPVQDAGLIHLRKLASLVALELARTKVTDKGVAEFLQGKIADGRGLWNLNLSNTAITDAAFPEDGRVPCIEINVSGTQISEGKIEVLGRTFKRFGRRRGYGTRYIWP